VNRSMGSGAMATRPQSPDLQPIHRNALRVLVAGLGMLMGCTDDPDMAPGPGNTAAGREKTGTAVTTPTPDRDSNTPAEPRGKGSSTGTQSSAGNTGIDPG
jgi:hypothetical protein